MRLASERPACVVLGLAMAMCAACGTRGQSTADGGGPGVDTCTQVMGTIRGGHFTVCDSSTVRVDADAGGPFLLVYLSSKPELCDSIGEGIVPTSPDVITIQLTQFNSMGMLTEVTPGTYSVPTGSASAFLASAVYNDGSAKCSVQASSGSVMLTTAGGSASGNTKGTFSFAFAGTDMLSGALDAPWCPPALPPDGGFPDGGPGMTPLCE